jgi:hypothetical protein
VKRLPFVPYFLKIPMSFTVLAICFVPRLLVYNIFSSCIVPYCCGEGGIIVCAALSSNNFLD